MPRVKIDYVVSFSSEDQDNQANNLLAWEVGKKRWLCKKGESSCSVVLQLARAVQISAIHIGAYQAALVEVLAGRSETPNDPYQVVVPSCVFLSPAESRRAAAADRVRSFSGAQLAAAAAQRWDRLRLVCSQPYNNHCQYGLSFVHVYEPERAGDMAAPPAAAAAAAAAVAAVDSSDEDDYRPGQLFAAVHAASADTGAQIRKATSQILKNILDSSKLVKSPIIKNSSKKQNIANDAPSTSRDRDGLVYTDEDNEPHSKIDQVVERHRHEKKDRDDAPKTNVRDGDSNKKHYKDVAKLSVKHEKKERDDASKTNVKDNNNDKKHKDVTDSSDNSSKRNKHNAHHTKHSDNGNKRDSMKRKRDDDESSSRSPHHKMAKDKSFDADNGGSSDPDEILSLLNDDNAAQLARVLAGACLVLSGYVHPQRARLQRLARALGARLLPAWGPACTHLICAFPSTPKLQQAHASGQVVRAARGEWLQACVRARRRLPWRWFASERRHQLPPPPPGHPAWNPSPPPPAPDDSDTDDDIEKVLQQQKRARSSQSPSRRPAGTGEGAGEEEEEEGDDTDTELRPREAEEEQQQGGGPLPDFFDGYTFAFADDVGDTFDKSLLSRYIQAYGGVVVDRPPEEAADVDYVVCGGGGGGGGGGRRVRADWVWRCHAARRLLPSGGGCV